jgi:hypothetical protein
MTTASHGVLTDEEIGEIRKRTDAATPGPWNAYIEGRDHVGGSSFIMTSGEDIELSAGATVADHDFIAHARQDIPRLLAELARLRRQK